MSTETNHKEHAELSCIERTLEELRRQFSDLAGQYRLLLIENRSLKRQLGIQPQPSSDSK